MLHRLVRQSGFRKGGNVKGMTFSKEAREFFRRCGSIGGRKGKHVMTPEKQAKCQEAQRLFRESHDGASNMAIYRKRCTANGTLRKDDR